MQAYVATALSPPYLIENQLMMTREILGASDIPNGAIPTLITGPLIFLMMLSGIFRLMLLS